MDARSNANQPELEIKHNSATQPSFYYTKGMIDFFVGSPGFLVLIGLLGYVGGPCHGIHLSSTQRVLAVTLGAGGTIIGSGVAIAGLIVTVPVDLAIKAKDHIKSHHQKTVFLPATKEENEISSQAPALSPSIS